LRVERLAEWIEVVLAGDTQFAVQLCLEGTVANIIMHSDVRDDRLAIMIELKRDGGTLVARIEDTGREFDPTQFPPLLIAKSLEDAKIGDYGIHLMRSFASGMHYERREGRNRLKLRFGGSDANSSWLSAAGC
jgi:serine/threonine-protein kinase RsbW